MNPNENLLSKSVVMERLGISDKTLRRLIQQRRLAVVKLGKTSPLKFRQLDVARFLESASVGGSGF
jgi:excisionase family DNA binding protein